MQYWTLDEFRAIPKTLDSVPPGTRTVVIIPAADGEELHDSGFRCMSLVFFGGGKMLGRSHYGHDHIQAFANPQNIRDSPAARAAIHGYEVVEMDCLPGSGLIQFWFGTNGFEGQYNMYSSAILRPAKHGNDVTKVDIHSDQMKDIQRKMAEWMKHFGKDEIRVAMDQVMEGL